MRSLLTLVFYAPSIAGNLFTIWLVIFDGDIYGYLNSLLLQFGFIKEPIQWLTDPAYMMAAVVVVQLWVSMGTSFLTMRAGFNTIDRQYYEAAAVDGVKNRWQELWYVTLPMMKPQLLFGAVMSITSAFSIHEVTVALAGFPSTEYAAHTMVNHMWDYGYQRFEMGYASAIAAILFLLMFVCRKLINLLLERVGR